MGALYSDFFYRTYGDESHASAREVVPLVVDLVRPQSVIDVGCGVGAWLAAFRENGVEDVTGLDGDYVDRSLLRIPADRFVAADLQQPFPVSRTFNLACSLEVAEHIPAALADEFVRRLTALAPVVLFSAAIPFQGGTEHINEQWAEYWVAKFDALDFRVVDCLRSRLWTNPKVAYYYAQNLLLFVRKDRLAGDRRLADLARASESSILSMVHPARWLEQNDVSRRYRTVGDIRRTLGQLIRAFPKAARNSFLYRMGRNPEAGTKPA